MIGIDLMSIRPLNTSSLPPQDPPETDPPGETSWWQQEYPGATFVADFQNNRAMINNQPAQFSDFLSITRPSDGYADNQDGSLTAYQNNELRIGTKGILIEALAINRVINSQNISGSGWNLLGPTSVLMNETTAPDGTQTADLLNNLQNVGDGVVYTNPNTLTIANTSYTASVYIKTDTPGPIDIILKAETGSSPPTIQTVNVTSAWQRIALSHSFNIDDNNFELQISRSSAGNLESLYIWGVQVEYGTYASSPIKTTGTQKIRYADAIPFHNLTWLDQTQGTILLNVQSNQGTITNRRLLGFASAQGLDTSPANNVVEEWNGSTLLSASSQTNSWEQGAKVALAWDSNGRSLCIGGGSVSSDNELINGLSNWYLGSRDGSQSFWQGYHKELVYWNTRVIDEELPFLTS